jgi:5'-methylthioadenosine phosphorylase
VRHAVALLPRERTCGCATAAKFAVMTSRDAIPAATREKLSVLYGKYLDA